MKKHNKASKQSASLTVEAAFVLPLFIYFIVAFLYFIQLFTLQEMIQKSITRVGLNTAKYTYVLAGIKDDKQNKDINSLLSMDNSVSLTKLIDLVVDGALLKIQARAYVNIDMIDNSCILDGWDGVSFMGSQVMDQDKCIDIIVRYYVRIPIRFLQLKDIPIIQRVKLRSWTGTIVDPKYYADENTEEGKTEEDKVFITETGTVYHEKRNCSHINIKVIKVIGVPHDRRNDNGAKYYPCERCGSQMDETQVLLYITSDGNRYHSSISCSGLKRTVIEVNKSEVSDRRPCKRCSE